MPHALTPFLMFDGVAEKAMAFYMSLFRGSEIRRVERYGPDDTPATGSVKRAEFTLAGCDFICVDSPVKHDYGFTPAISIFVECEDDREIEEAFLRLSDGGSVLMPLNDYGFSRRFGWLNDRFGVSWQLNLR